MNTVRQIPPIVLTAFATAAAVFAAPSGVNAESLKAISPVEEIAVENGTPLVDALFKLPNTTSILFDDGSSRSVDLAWSLSEYVKTSRGGNIVAQAYLPRIRGAYEMTGSFALPESVTRTDVTMPTQVKTMVNIEGGELASLDDQELFDQPGQYGSKSMQFGDVERSYHYYVPSDYVAGEALPLMFTFHGAGSHGVGQLSYSDFDVVAEREGFIVVAPDYGVSALGRFDTPGVADFTAAIIDDVDREFTIDPRRIYASGISMGGSASFTLAHELSDRIAAIAPVASSARGVLERTLPRPIPIVWFYGTRDSRYGPELLLTVDHLVEQNKSSPRPAVKTWTPTEDDPTGITRLTYPGGDNGADTIFYRIDEGGHTWPGKYQYSSLINVGLTSQHIDASDVIWEHLRSHTLPQ